LLDSVTNNEAILLRKRRKKKEKTMEKGKTGNEREMKKEK